MLLYLSKYIWYYVILESLENRETCLYKLHANIAYMSTKNDHQIYLYLVLKIKIKYTANRWAHENRNKLITVKTLSVNTMMKFSQCMVRIIKQSDSA